MSNNINNANINELFVLEMTLIRQFCYFFYYIITINIERSLTENGLF